MKKLSRALCLVVLVFISAFVFVSCAQQRAETESVAPKYVFMFIGDGMSSPQINATKAYLNRKNNTPGAIAITEGIGFTKFPAQGRLFTYDSTSFIPDSASTGTALASGTKTANGAIGMGQTNAVPDNTKKVESIATKLKNMGKKVGIVSTVNLNNATPSAYYANVEFRDYAYELSTQLAKSNFDYFAGGGLSKPTDSITQQELDKGYLPRVDNAYTYLQQNGYTVTESNEQFNALNASSGKVYCKAPNLQDDYSMYYGIDAKPEDITLTQYVTKGIELLDNDNGFFMMVEGGKIDWACHANDALPAILELLEFDNAIKQAVKFYNKHPKETLIVVTGDHETGGLAMGQTINSYGTNYAVLDYQKVSYIEFEKHINDNMANWNTLDDAMPYIKANFGLTKKGDVSNGIALELSDYQYSKIQTAFEVTKNGKPDSMSQEEYNHLYGYYVPLTVAVTQTLNSKASIGWTTFYHTGADTLVFAIGAGSAVFNGAYENTDVYNKLAQITKVA